MIITAAIAPLIVAIAPMIDANTFGLASVILTIENDTISQIKYVAAITIIKEIITRTIFVDLVFIALIVFTFKLLNL